MFKKSILVFIIATGVLSCFCDDMLPFWGVRNFEMTFFENSMEVTATDTITSDSLNVIVDFELEYFSEVSFKNIFTNQAMALSCDNAGYNGMKDAITKITLTTDTLYNTYAAGSSLNDIVSYNQKIGFQDFISEVGTFQAVSAFAFLVIEKPTNLDSVKFNLELEFESGEKVSQESEYLRWR